MSRANPRFRRQNTTLPAPTGNVYRAFILGTLENQLTISGFAYMDTQTIGVGVSNGMTQLANNIVISGNLATKYAAVTSADWTMTVVKIDSPNNPTVAPLILANSLAGTGAAGHVDNKVAITILKQTAVRGQCGRGRVSIPAVPATGVSGSRILFPSPLFTAITSLTTQINTVVNQGGLTFNPGLFSKGTRLSQVKGFAPYITASGVSFTTLLGSVRRRKIGRGK